MGELTAEKYRELFRMRAEGKLPDMECTKSLYRLLKPLHFDGMSILDMPCGTGHYYRKLRQLGKIRYLGIDIDEKMIATANEIWKGEPNAKFRKGSALELELEDNSVDVVFCYNLLLHLPPEYCESVISELYRVSKRYVLIRSLFDDVSKVELFTAPTDYKDVYGNSIYYNTYARSDIQSFCNEGLGALRVTFMQDIAKVPEATLKQQEKVLGVDPKEFAYGKTERSEYFKGLELNYEILMIEKPQKQKQTKLEGML